MVGATKTSRVGDHGDVICNPECLAHQGVVTIIIYLITSSVFGMDFVDTTQCALCGEVSEPSSSSWFVYRIYVADVLSQVHPTLKKRKKGI